MFTLYLRVRSFSHAKDILNSHKFEKASEKKKSLRKEIKRAVAEHTEPKMKWFVRCIHIAFLISYIWLRKKKKVFIQKVVSCWSWTQNLKILLNVLLLHQGRQDILEAQAQNYKVRPLVGEASRKYFRSHTLDWLKMHFRSFPGVKMLKIFKYEAP